MSLGKIIAVFPCSGKTHYVLNNFHKESCIDHDFYDWMYRGNLGHSWLVKYIFRMKDLRKKFKFVYVNTLPTIINELPKDSIVIYPNRSLKEEWIQRAIKRGGETAFPLTLGEKWDYWLDACNTWEGKKYELQSGQYLSDIQKELKCLK